VDRFRIGPVVHRRSPVVETCKKWHACIKLVPRYITVQDSVMLHPPGGLGGFTAPTLQEEPLNIESSWVWHISCITNEVLKNYQWKVVESIWISQVCSLQNTWTSLIMQEMSQTSDNSIFAPHELHINQKTRFEASRRCLNISKITSAGPLNDVSPLVLNALFSSSAITGNHIT